MFHGQCGWNPAIFLFLESHDIAVNFFGHDTEEEKTHGLLFEESQVLMLLDLAQANAAVVSWRNASCLGPSQVLWVDKSSKELLYSRGSSAVYTICLPLSSLVRVLGI